MYRQTDNELVELLQDISRNDRLSIELDNGTTCTSHVEWNKSRRQRDRPVSGEIRIAIEIDSDEIPAPLDVFPNQVLRIVGQQQPEGDYARPVFYISEDERLTGMSDRALHIKRIDIKETA